MRSGVSTLIIASSIKDADWFSTKYEASLITREFSEYHIFKTMIDFQEGKINRLVSTNIAAQGLNLPCENLILHLNNWDGKKDICQKIGRLGRPFMGKNDIALTVSYHCDMDSYDASYHSATEKRLDAWDNRLVVERIVQPGGDLAHWRVNLDHVPEPDKDYQEPGRDRGCELLIYKQLKKRWRAEAEAMNNEIIRLVNKPEVTASEARERIPEAMWRWMMDEEDMTESEVMEKRIATGDRYYPV